MCKRIKILHLKNEKIIVNGSDILAFDDGMQWLVYIITILLLLLLFILLLF